MNYLSVCSGVEAATVAWHHMGWNPVGFSEIEKFPSQVLAHRYPSVTNFGDMSKYKEWQIDGTIGLLVGGTPCQSFSVAGLRKGLEDPRGNLALTYVGILDHFRPKWFVWENVPGVLSSGGGRDFGSFLGAVAQCGYGFAYRVLDAQYVGGPRAVPQRRRRVFVVGCLGDWESAAKVLFESESLRRDTAKSRKKGETVTDYVKSSVGALCARDYKGLSSDDLNAGKAIVEVYENHPSDSRVREMGDVCQTVTSTWGTGGGNIPFVQEVFRKSRRAQSVNDYETWVDDGKANTINTFDLGDIRTTHAVAMGFTQCDAARDVGQNISPTLRSGGDGGYPAHSVAYGFEPGIAKREGNPNRFSEEISPTLRAEMGDNQVSMANSMAVRRLTPVECERLQGFPDNYTNIRENCPDGPRYKAMGNSMAVPVMRWIGERINKVNNEQ